MQVMNVNAGQSKLSSIYPPTLCHKIDRKLPLLYPEEPVYFLRLGPHHHGLFSDFAVKVCLRLVNMCYGATKKGPDQRKEAHTFPILIKIK